MRAAILAIGTELTTGQITNRNAAWISEKLDGLGVSTALHLTVADDRGEILRALDWVESSADWIFVTGGLGPTSDDFTREVLAQWVGKSLTWREESWTRIQSRLGSFGIRVAESNRQQCYFPEGARVLTNREGTADAFALEKKGPHGLKQIWVLPGPPREIDAVWRDHVGADLAQRLPARERRELLLWQLLGKSEAEVGEITEAALSGTGLLTGYRVHRPYVEVKVWAPLREKQTPEIARALAQLDAALTPWTVTRGKPEFALQLWKKLAAHEDILIIDQLTQGVLNESLFPYVRAQSREHDQAPRASQELVIHTCSETPTDHRSTVEAQLGAMDPETLGLAIAGFDASGSFTLGMSLEGRLRVETLQSPWKTSPALLDRSQRFAAETALRLWASWLVEQ